MNCQKGAAPSNSSVNSRSAGASVGVRVGGAGERLAVDVESGGGDARGVFVAGCWTAPGGWHAAARAARRRRRRKKQESGEIKRRRQKKKIKPARKRNRYR